MREITLSNGMIARVSNCDYDYLMRWKWTASPSNWKHSGEWNRQYYAARWLCLGKVNGKRKRKKIYMHVEVCIRKGAIILPGNVVNHRDFDRLNNQRRNLHPATYSENALHAVDRSDEWR